MGDGTSGRVVLFTRYPTPGETKTRLIPELGKAGSARLQKALTEHIVTTLNRFREREDLDLRIRFEGGSEEKMHDWLGDAGTFVQQGTGDLGDRMSRTMNRAFDEGIERVVIVGSDCPGISGDHVRRALEWLETRDLVLGPARDGGYYLIGLSTPADELFEEVPWGTGAVLDTTLERAKAHGRSFRMLEELRDVDRPADLDAVPENMDVERWSTDAPG